MQLKSLEIIMETSLCVRNIGYVLSVKDGMRNGNAFLLRKKKVVDNLWERNL